MCPLRVSSSLARLLAAFFLCVARAGSLETAELSTQSLDQPNQPLQMSNSSPLWFRLSDFTYFAGTLSDVRRYRGAVVEAEIVHLAGK